ncbi:MAG: hypothetical protein ACW98I_20660 [Candidatus Hodarchaeales archaeon]|jgi:hypothetical protein
MSKLENLKKSIRTICQQFPQFLVKFDLAEQELINEFLMVVSNFEEADNNRGGLSKRFQDYSESMLKTQGYLELPFLWLTVCIAENAVYHLSISRFYALEFYKFLLYQLRSIFSLIKRGFSLSSVDFERLQVKCEEPEFVLSSDEMEILKTTYSLLDVAAIDSLNSKTIKEENIKNLILPRKFKTQSELLRFYTLVGGQWWFQFHPSAFGLSRVLVHLHLSKNIELKQIIDFTDPENTVLGLSNIHQVRNSESEYIGTLLIPTGDIDILHTHFRKFEEQAQLKVIEFTIIDQIKRSSAFSLYKPDLGWQKLPSNDRETIIRNLKLIDRQEKRKNQEDDASSSNFPVWSFNQDDQPSEIIKMYCMIPDQYSFNKLPYDFLLKSKNRYFTLEDLEFVKKVYTEDVLNVGFTPWRLIYNYSVRRFCIKTPKIDPEKVIPLLDFLPYAEIYQSRQEMYIWTRLRDDLVSWITNKLKWTILPVVRINPIPDLNFEWFDTRRMQWFTPKVLRSQSK